MVVVVEAVSKGSGTLMVKVNQRSPRALAPAISSALRFAFVTGLSTGSLYSLKRPVARVNVSVSLTAAGLLSRNGNEEALRLSFS